MLWIPKLISLLFEPLSIWMSHVVAINSPVKLIVPSAEKPEADNISSDTAAGIQNNLHFINDIAVSLIFVLHEILILDY